MAVVGVVASGVVDGATVDATLDAFVVAVWEVSTFCSNWFSSLSWARAVSMPVPHSW